MREPRRSEESDAVGISARQPPPCNLTQNIQVCSLCVCVCFARRLFLFQAKFGSHSDAFCRLTAVAVTQTAAAILPFVNMRGVFWRREAFFFFRERGRHLFSKRGAPCEKKCFLADGKVRRRLVVIKNTEKIKNKKSLKPDDKSRAP